MGSCEGIRFPACGIHWEGIVMWGLRIKDQSRLWKRGVMRNLPASAGDTCSVPGLGRYPGEGNGNSPQYSCLGHPMDRGAWWATVHGFTESWTWWSTWAQQKVSLHSGGRRGRKNPSASPTLPAFPLVTLTVSAIQLPDSSPNTVDCFQTPDLCKMQWSLAYVAFLPLWKSSSYSPSQTWFQGHSLLSHPQHLPAQCTGLWWYHISLSMTIRLRVYCTHLVLCVSHQFNGHEFEQAPGVGDR